MQDLSTNPLTIKLYNTQYAQTIRCHPPKGSSRHHRCRVSRRSTQLSVGVSLSAPSLDPASA